MKSLHGAALELNNTNIIESSNNGNSELAENVEESSESRSVIVPPDRRYPSVSHDCHKLSAETTRKFSNSGDYKIDKRCTCHDCIENKMRYLKNDISPLKRKIYEQHYLKYPPKCDRAFYAEQLNTSRNYSNNSKRDFGNTTKHLTRKMNIDIEEQTETALVLSIILNGIKYTGTLLSNIQIH